MTALRQPGETVLGRLEVAGCVAAAEEAEQLVAAAPDDDTLEAWIRRREQGEPLAWILGTVEFCGYTVSVASGVYVPRFQSEELASRASALLADSGGRAIDLCTGSGAVALCLMANVPNARVVGVDIDKRAVACARRNGLRTVLGDVGEPLRHSFSPGFVARAL